MGTETQTRLGEIDTRLNEIADALQVIEDRTREWGETTDMSETAVAQRSRAMQDLNAESDDLVDEAQTLNAEAKPLREREARRSRLAGGLHGGGARFSEPGDGGGRNDPTVISRTRTLAFEGLERVDSLTKLDGSELARRGEASIEYLRRSRGIPQENADYLGRFLDPFDDAEGAPPRSWQQVQRSNAAALVTAASSPAYVSAFWKLFRNPQLNVGLDFTDDERHAVQRARQLSGALAGEDREWRRGGLQWGDEYAVRALSLTNASGGYLVPFTLDPSVVLSNGGSANPWRQVSTIKRTSTNTWNGVTSAGMNAAWLAEAATVTDNSPTFGNIQITPQKAAAWCFGSYEILEDSDFETQLPEFLADARDRLESTAFAVGTGSGQPFGAITRATASAIGGGLITVAGLQTVHGALSPRFRNARPAWLANVTPADAMRSLPMYTNGPPMLQGNRMAMWDEPFYEASDMNGTIAVGGNKVVAYMDGNQYYIVDRIGMSVIYEPMIKDPTAGVGRPTGQGGWYAFWRVGADATFGASSAAIRNLTLT